MERVTTWAQNEIWPWKQSEIIYLKAMYPSDKHSFQSICDFLSRSRGSVSGKARVLGLRRP